MAIEQIDSSDWPTGDTSRLLILSLEPDELSERLGLEFMDDMDDLGPLKIAVVKSPKFGVAGLIRYLDAPFRGTSVHVDSDADIRIVCQAVLEELGVTEADVDQMATDLRWRQ